MDFSLLRTLALMGGLFAGTTGAGYSQAQNQVPVTPGTQSLPGAKGSGSNGTAGSGQQGGDSKSASGSASGKVAAESATGEAAGSPFAPAAPPARTFARPRIGLALGGGGALGLSEIGTLEWLEENHVPVDVIAGTSMGCMISALYSTGRTPEQLKSVMNDRVFASVFSFSNAYTSRSFRRREDSRDLPNGITVGLKHGVSFRNSVLTDQGLNAFLDRQFLRYDDRTDFNTLPIPLRCLSTDLNDARTVTFARGSLPDAIRASVSLPGVYSPFQLNGHEFVDGGVLENLPTRTVKNMDADVVLAVSLPLTATGKGDLGSIVGVLGRSFSVAIEGAEREQRKLADVVIMPDLTGFTATDYLKTEDLAKRGYAAAERHRAELLKYALPDAEWVAYLRHRAGLVRGPAGPVLRVRVTAPNESATRAVQRLFAPLVNEPVDTRRIEALLDQVRADGRYEADYTVGYESAEQFAQGEKPAGTVEADPSSGQVDKEKDSQAASETPAVRATLADDPNAPGLARTQAANAKTLADIATRPIILVTVAEKKTGPPFLLAGGNLQAQAAGRTRATFETILLNQDLGGYGAELRTHIKLGYLTDLSTEYFRPVVPGQSPGRTLFFAPRAGLLRQPFPIYANQVRLAERQFQRLGAGGDFGFTNTRTTEVRAGYDFAHVRWDRQIGDDGQADYNGHLQRARVQFAYDTQDRALVPQFGVHVVAEAAYLFDTVGSADAPEVTVVSSYAHRFGAKTAAAQSSTQTVSQSSAKPGATQSKPKGANVFILGAEGGTYFNRTVAEPFRYTLGGPLRLSASAIDEYRGTDYALLEPALLHRIAQLPQPLGQNIYVGGAFEFGYIRSADGRSLNREDVFFGLVAETPLGVVTVGPAVGTNGERKFNFTLGKLF